MWVTLVDGKKHPYRQKSFQPLLLARNGISKKQQHLFLVEKIYIENPLFIFTHTERKIDIDIVQFLSAKRASYSFLSHIEIGIRNSFFQFLF